MVLLVATSWWTAENGELEYHRYSGYALLGVLCFRLYWGVVGSSTARFTNFVRGPQAVFAYLRPTPVTNQQPIAQPGHNPLGALSVIALLAMLFAQVALGLFAVDVDGIESGPLSFYVSFDTGRACAELHEELFDVLVWFIALHVLAVLFYQFYKRQNLIGGMLHGQQSFDQAPLPVTFASGIRLVIGIAIAALLVWLTTRAFQL
jgi:cytochrome b